MATNYPNSTDDSSTLPNPSASSTTLNVSLSAGQSNQNDAIKALEAKLGTGASTPIANTLMFGTGTGTSAWTAVTSSQLRSTISDETGTGSAVFATTPTLVTPKVDTINESTPANGVTIDGLNIKGNKLNTNDSVVTANITNASVTPSKLATGAAASTVITASETTTSTSYTDLATTTDTVTVTIGANGLALVIISCIKLYNNTGASETYVSFAVSGSSTVAASDNSSMMVTASGANVPQIGGGASFLVTGLTPGSNTFKMKYRVTGNTGGCTNRKIAVVPL